MKRIAVVLMAAFMMSAAVPVMAAEMSKADKDQCLLYSKSCVHEVDSLQQKIHKLNKEIKKGTKVYSTEELKKLNEKLKDAEDFMDKMTIE
jgi:uncharacterized protein YlxW (UPF0749 family)